MHSTIQFAIFHLLFLAACGCGPESGNVSESPISPTTQSDDKPDLRPGEKAAGETTDVQRISDVHAIARIVEYFKGQTGHYPFEEAYLQTSPGSVAVPATVLITRHEVPEQYRYPPPGVSGTVFLYDDFAEYLSQKLGEAVKLPSDSEAAPRFYQYHFDGQNYYISAALFEPTETTRQVALRWNKYEVSSTSVPARKIRRFSEIDAD